MAQVLIEARQLLSAVDRAVDALAPSYNQMKSAWNEQEHQLNELRAAAEWAISHPIGSKLIGLDARERSLIGPYIT